MILSNLGYKIVSHSAMGAGAIVESGETAHSHNYYVEGGAAYVYFSNKRHFSSIYSVQFYMGKIGSALWWGARASGV